MSARDMILSDAPVEVIFQAHRVVGRMQFLSFSFFNLAVLGLGCGMWDL